MLHGMMASKEIKAIWIHTLQDHQRQLQGVRDNASL